MTIKEFLHIVAMQVDKEVAKHFDKEVQKYKYFPA